MAYERGTELNEGLAQYVEGLAAGRKDSALRDFGPTEVRQRGYLSGEAMARILDRVAPGWKSKVAGSLDELAGHSKHAPAGAWWWRLPTVRR